MLRLMKKNKIVEGNKQLLFLLIIIIIICPLYCYLPLKANGLFDSPDENANFQFIKVFAEKSDFTISQPLNTQLEGVVHPRNTVVNNQGEIAPLGFLGFPLIMGCIAKPLPINWLYFFIPLFSLLTVVVFYFFITSLSGEKKLGFLSALLLLITAPFMYYSNRSFMANILFVDFFILGVSFCYFSLQYKKLYWYLLAAILLSFTLTIRLVEIWWLALAIVIVLIVYRHQVRWWYLIIAVFLAGIIFSGYFYYNHQTYGHFLSTGYRDYSSLQDQVQTTTKSLKDYLFPFDFSLNDYLQNSYYYLIRLLPLWALFTFFGLITFLRNKTIKQGKYLLIFFFTTLIALTFYYGSSEYFGNFRTHDQPVIGSSFARYWLPIYIFALPLIAGFLLKLKEKYKSLGKILLLFFITLYLLFNIDLVYNDADTGLLQIENKITEYQSIKEKVLSLTEEQAVIWAESNDKYLFPQRSVIYALDLPDDIKILQKAVNLVPVYYFTDRSVEELEIFNNQYLRINGLNFQWQNVVNGNNLFYLEAY